MSNDYSALKVVDLKKELKTRGLSTAGNKDELIERLNTYTQNLLGSASDIDGFSESIAENDILDEDVLNEELDYDEDELKKSADLDFTGSVENASLDLPNDVSAESNNSSLNVTVVATGEEKPLPQRESAQMQQKNEKKVHIIRNRSLSVLSDIELKENEKTEEISSGKSHEEKNEENGGKLITKITGQTLNERLEQRKRKFGVLKEEDKKKARAARFGITTEPSGGNVKAVDTSKTKTETADILKSRAQRFGLIGSSVDKNKTLEVLKTRAERFGSIVSPLLSKLSEEEKMQSRKNRFLGSTTDTLVEEKKKLRAQRFNIAS